MSTPLTPEQQEAVDAIIKSSVMAAITATRAHMTANPTAPTVTVVSPKIGGLGGEHNKTAWTGGAPDAQWTNSTRTGPKTANCFRFVDSAKALKSENFITKCETQKFKRANPEYPLSAFSADAKRHMEKVGMDSVFYFLNPTDATEQLSIFTYHSRFTKIEVELQVQTRIAGNTYDHYDVENLELSRDWLMNALDETILTTIRPQILESMTGPELYMLILSEVQSDSVRTLRQKERGLEKLALADFPAEDVKAMNSQILSTCNELERAECLPSDVTVTIVEKYGEATSEEFRIHFLQRRSQVEAFIKASAGKDATVKATMPGRITYRSLVDESNEKYQTLLESSKWVPTNADKGAAPFAYMTAADVEGLLQQKLTALAAVSGALKGETRDYSGTKCFKCGQLGHISTNCTQAGGGTPGKGWQTVPPVAGAAETCVRNTKTFHWCGMCKRWSTTHGTATHRNKADGAAAVPAAVPAAVTPVVEGNAAATQLLSPMLGNYGAW